MPSKSASPAVEMRLLSGGVSLNQSSNTTLLPVRLQWAAGRHDGSALLDSGAEGNLMDRTLAHRLNIPTTSLRHKIPVSALNGQPLSDITHSTIPVTLITSGNHTETMEFFITDSPMLRWCWAIPGSPGTTQESIGARVPSLHGVTIVMRLVLCLLVPLCLVFHCRIRW